MDAFLIIFGFIVTVILAVGIPTLLLSYGFALPWLKALAVTFGIAMVARNSG